jgi:hypothetical protein
MISSIAVNIYLFLLGTRFKNVSTFRRGHLQRLDEEAASALSFPSLINLLYVSLIDRHLLLQSSSTA